MTEIFSPTTQDVARRAVAASFIIDQDPIFPYMGWHLAHSLAARAHFRWSDIHVQFTPEVSEKIVDIFRCLGCATHRLVRFGDGNYCNKLGQWENLRDIEADHIVFLDTDMICVSAFAELLPSDSIGGKIVDLPNPEIELLDSLFNQAGFEDRPETVPVDATDEYTYRANCNGGFYSVPKQFAEPLFDAWRKQAQFLLANADSLRDAGKEAHVDQIAFCMAVHDTGLPFEHLVSNVNYYVHFRGPHTWLDTHRPLAMLHYHNKSLSMDGLLEPAGASDENACSAVDGANSLIAENMNAELLLGMRRDRLGAQPRQVSLAGADAWLSLLDGPFAQWSNRVEHLNDKLVRVAHEPKFALSPNDRFFCMGSCFARNIEEHLIYQGIDVLSKRLISPAGEYPGRPNALVNKFSTHSMANELEWIEQAPEFDSEFFAESETGWHDLQLSPGTTPVRLDRAIDRRCYLSSQYFSRVRDATVIVLTLGLNEVWHDSATGWYLNAAPSFFGVRREPSRYTLHITDVAENIGQLEKIHDIVCSINPEARFLVTVSPVPMSATFSGTDVLVANLRSKSTLRVAAETFALSHDRVDYFPSYDMVAMSPRHLAYQADCLHVESEVVGEIIQEFMRLYMGVERMAPLFDESAYCVANPDVEAAIRRGELTSGFDHWNRHGRAEGRQLAPTSGPFAFPWLQGAVG
jgi:hypothetical protein